MNSKFKVRWEASDGYAGNARPQFFDVAWEDIEEDMDDADLEKLFYELLHEAFLERVTPEPENFEEFMEWARDVVARKSA